MEERKTGFAFLFTVCLIFTFSVLFGGFFSKAESVPGSGSSSDKCFTSIEIEPGDTLWSIAQEYATDEYESIEHYISEVKDINSLTGDNICAGAFLTLPYYEN